VKAINDQLRNGRLGSYLWLRAATGNRQLWDGNDAGTNKGQCAGKDESNYGREQTRQN
jgi:hypothetical protein